MSITIGPRMTVNAAIQQCPQLITIFSRRGIDTCCGGALPIVEAARRHGIDVEKLLADINGVAADDTAANIKLCTL